MGAHDHYRKDLYGQLVWAIHTLSEGFYCWQSKTCTGFTFPDGSTLTPAPDLNAGSFALAYFFAHFHSEQAWEGALDKERGFPATYAEMFGDPWEETPEGDSLLPDDLSQPPLSLPFEPGVPWTFTGGPHFPFEGSGPWAALDFGPPMEECGCHPCQEWVVAAANGFVVRSGNGSVIQDLDGDGFEQTGWSILYLDIDEKNRVPEGTYLHTGDRVGHPSCAGGALQEPTYTSRENITASGWLRTDPFPLSLEGGGPTPGINLTRVPLSVAAR
ncbi:MAG: hypothetical protein R6U51_01345 [Anaerolineales bacterium]